MFSSDNVAYLDSPRNVTLSQMFWWLFLVVLGGATIGLGFTWINDGDLIAASIALWTFAGFILLISFYPLIVACRSCCCSPIHFKLNGGYFSTTHSVTLPQMEREEAINAFAEIINL
jgi:hypothetical protein